jgi:hypothetical protein
VSLVEQELLSLPGHLSSPPVFSGVRVNRSLVLYVCFGGRCLSFCTFSFGHCVVFSSSIYGFWLSLWYLQTLLEWKCQILLLNYTENGQWRLLLRKNTSILSASGRVWRYQRGYQNRYVEEGQTTQWPKENVQKDK